MKVEPNLFKTGIRPVIDDHIAKLAQERRDYGDYWSASSAGYCMRKLFFERLNIPYVSEDARKQRVFSAGHVFHEWIQRLTLDAGITIGQEVTVKDDELMILGHIDDLIVLNGKLIVYDYKSTHSKSFSGHYPLSHYHKMQTGTYLYLLRNDVKFVATTGLKPEEARILKISKDDLRMAEHQLMWSPELEKEVVSYWTTLNGYWKKFKIPACTCDKFENGFMAIERFNPYFYEGEPCSMAWYDLQMSKAKDLNGTNTKSNFS